MEKRRRTYKIILTLCIWVFISNVSYSQIGGRNSYEFLRLPVSGRLTGLGGALIGVQDGDVNLAMSNPAALNSKMDGAIALNNNFHFAGISYGHAAFGKHISKYGITTQIAASYMNYGSFSAADEVGVQNGTFSAYESGFTLGAAKAINERIHLGANLKLVNSAFESYNSIGIAADLGAIYVTNSDRTVISAVFKNFGSELTTLNGQRFGTPFDIQLGLSQRLKYLPLRIGFILHNLQQWSIRYDDPNRASEIDLLGGANEPSALNQTIDNFFRHVIINGEFLLGKLENLKLRIGYNHLRRKELSIPQLRSRAGFSLGFGMKISKFSIDYGVGYHHITGGTNHLSIMTNLQEFRSKL